MNCNKIKSLTITSLLTASLFTGYANAGLIVDDEFNTLDSTVWTVEGGSVTGSGSSEFYSGNALHFNGENTREAITSSFDMSTGGLLSFMLKIGGANDTNTFEEADNGEDILVQYSNDGASTWNQLQLIDTLDAAHSDVWGNVSISMAADAANSSTQFRFSQIKHSGTAYDNWAIDNVQISNFASVSEPSAMMIFALGLAGFAARRRK